MNAINSQLKLIQQNNSVAYEILISEIWNKNIVIALFLTTCMWNEL